MRVENMNNRRNFLIALAAGAFPLPVLSQPAGKRWRIGFISGAARSPSIENSFIGGFLQGDKRALRYRIRGNLSVAGGMRIPFDRSGEFDLGVLAPK